MKGERVRAGKEGGLSRALKIGSSPGDVSSQEQEEQSSAPKQNSGNAEGSLFGRSPSRTFHSANHLLNFQSNRSRVSRMCHATPKGVRQELGLL